VAAMPSRNDVSSAFNNTNAPVAVATGAFAAMR
jgi:hypothetical protein